MLISVSVKPTSLADITSDITVYRFSIPILVNYLRGKVCRLAASEVFKCSRSLVRGLAKEGLMEDGKEHLLLCKLCFFVPSSLY
jgi:hypothetical protein